MAEEIQNRVQRSGLQTLDLESLVPQDEIVSFDIADYLFQGLILREKDFRTSLKELDYTPYQDQITAVYCSADAIVPDWAYMLITAHLMPYTSMIYHGTPDEVKKDMLIQNIRALDGSLYDDKRIIIKGCGSPLVDSEAYLEISKKLIPYVKSLMYGEPCSTVPIYKKKKV